VPPPPTQRHLAAILIADAVGYARLLERDQADTFRLFAESRQVIEDCVEERGGRMVYRPGHELMAEFPSVAESVAAAVEIQRTLESRNAELAPEARMQFRIGVNVGDVLVAGESIDGEGVNIAARLEALAMPGEVCVSGAVYDQVRNQIGVDYEYLGAHQVEELPERVRAYRLGDRAEVVLPAPTGPAIPALPPREERAPERGFPYRMAAMVALAVVMIVLAYQLPEIMDALESRRNERADATPGESTDPASSAAVRDDITLAVLPFANTSNDSTQEYFADGISEELLTTLDAIDGLNVTGRTSSFAFKRKLEDLRGIAQQLGVAHILTGGVERSGDEVQLTALLIKAADGAQIWQGSYDVDLEDVFEMQAEIASEIARALGIEPGSGVRDSLSWRATKDSEAHILYLQGIHHLQRGTASDSRRAAELLGRARERDPDWAAAHVAYAQAQIAGFLRGLGSSASGLKAGRGAILRALELAPDYSAAHATLAQIHGYGGEWERAEAAARKAIELDAHSSARHFLGSTLLWVKGQPKQANAQNELYLEHEPLDIATIGQHAETLAALGRVEQALEEMERALLLAPDDPASYARLGGIFTYRANDYAKGLYWYDLAMQRDPKNSQLPLDVLRMSLDLGDLETAQAILSRLEYADPIGSELAEVRVDIFRGETEEAAHTARRVAENMQDITLAYHYFIDFAWLRNLQIYDPESATRFYERQYPELLQDDPQVTAWNHAAAISLAELRLRGGKVPVERKAGERLLERALEQLNKMSADLFTDGLVAVHTLMGNNELALAALRKGIDRGYRDHWYLMESEPMYEGLREEPAYQTMIDEIFADMALQLMGIEDKRELRDLPSY
jgi:adenylate cyclase